ncbi:MAG: AAA family ATPase [Proteobacteria bacterium]|nr:AAA family ATPase [Pseudomonadota bacterium]
MWDNLNALEGQPAAKNLQNLRQWTARQLDRLEPVLQRRFDDGFVRECHGDLHLSNLLRLPGGITAFDCIEFGAEFGNIGVMSDLAFLVMDLVSRQRTDLAYRFLNRYLELTGDYDSMEIFTLYFVYRCLVRAKVAAIRSQERKHDNEVKSDLSKVRKYCEIALQQTLQPTPILIVMQGLSGSGKTWLSRKLVSEFPAIRVRADIERKRMLGMDELADSESGVGEGIYSEDASRDTYDRLLCIAEIVLRAGHSIIVDASYLKIAERDKVRKLAARCGSHYILVQTCARDETLRRRIRKRSNLGDDASEARLNILKYQQQHAAKLTAVEHHSALRICTDVNIDIVDLAGRIRKKIA